MTKLEITLQPSKGVIAESAARIYGAYVAAGRVEDEKVNEWIKRSIREAMAIAQMIDASIQSDGELSPAEKPHITPPDGGTKLPSLAGDA